MKPADAQALFAELRAAYPNASVDADTLRIYQRELRPMNLDLAKEAVGSAIGSCRFLPTIAELHHHYAIAREQKRRRDEEENRRLERIAEDNLPRVPLQEIPTPEGTVAEFLAKLQGADPTAELNFERVGDGKCDDCPEQGSRFKFFRLALCGRCLVRRLRAQEQVAEDAA